MRDFEDMIFFKKYKDNNEKSKLEGIVEDLRNQIEDKRNQSKMLEIPSVFKAVEPRIEYTDRGFLDSFD